MSSKSALFPHKTISGVSQYACNCKYTYLSSLDNYNLNIKKHEFVGTVNVLIFELFVHVTTLIYLKRISLQGLQHGLDKY